MSTPSTKARPPFRPNFKSLTILILSVMLISLVSQVTAVPTSRLHSVQRSRSNHSQMTLNGVKKSSFTTPTAILPSSVEHEEGNVEEGSEGSVGSRKIHHRSHRKRGLEEDDEEDRDKVPLSSFDSHEISSRDQVSWAIGVNRVLDTATFKTSERQQHRPKSNANSTSKAADRKVKIHQHLKILQNQLHDSKGLKQTFKTAVVSGNKVQFLAQNTGEKSASKNGINLSFTLEKLRQFKSKWNQEAENQKSGGSIVKGTQGNVQGTSTSISNSSATNNATAESSQKLKALSGDSFKVSEALRAGLVSQAASDANSTSNYGSWAIGDAPPAATLNHGEETSNTSASSNSNNKTPSSTIPGLNSAASPTPTSGLSSSSVAQSFLSTSAGLSGPKSVVMLLTSNDENYGPSAILSDLRSLQKWAGDVGSLSKSEESEVVAAVLSASSRYFPELPTKMISRVLLSDMKAESDFSPRLISPGRLDSGSSYGLLQISPGNGSQELSLFKDHVVTINNKRSWVMLNSAKNVLSAGKYDPSNGRNVDQPLLDWKTGKRLSVSDLAVKDLFRPWVNIHAAAWIQSNLARTKSQDPYNWNQINKNAAYVQTLANSLSAIPSKSDSRTVTADALFKAINNLDDSLDGDNYTAKINATVATALGSWVAGPASTGPGGYLQKGDDISEQYLKAVMAGVEHLYGKRLGVQWLESLKLNKGLVDYRS